MRPIPALEERPLRRTEPPHDVSDPDLTIDVSCGPDPTDDRLGYEEGFGPGDTHGHGVSGQIFSILGDCP